MLPSIDMQSVLQNSNENVLRIESSRLMHNEDFVMGDKIIVTDNDVLLGRGGKNNQHPGNEKLRLMAIKYSSFYRAATKKEKPAISLLLVYLVQSTKPNGRFLKQGVKEWEVVPEQVAREKASQCLRDTVATASKLREEAKVPRGGTTADELLNGIELEEAKTFVCASMAVLTGQTTRMDGEKAEPKHRETSTPDFPASSMKRSRSVPYNNSEADQHHYVKRPRQCASASDLGSTTFGAYNYRSTTFHPFHTYRVPLGDARHECEAEVEFLCTNNYSLGNDVLGSCPGNDDEYACVKQAILKAEQLKNDDSAFQRLIDRMLRE